MLPKLLASHTWTHERGRESVLRLKDRAAEQTRRCHCYCRKAVHLHSVGSGFSTLGQLTGLPEQIYLRVATSGGAAPGSCIRVPPGGKLPPGHEFILRQVHKANREVKKYKKTWFVPAQCRVIEELCTFCVCHCASLPAFKDSKFMCMPSHFISIKNDMTTNEVWLQKL